MKIEIEANEWEFFLSIYPDKKFWLEFDMNDSIYQNISRYLEQNLDVHGVN